MEFINTLNDCLWSYVITIVLIGAAIFFTVRLLGVQFRYLGDGIRVLLGRNRNPHKPAYYMQTGLIFRAVSNNSAIESFSG